MSVLTALKRKSNEIYNGLFDFGTGNIRNGFYPIQQGGQAAPPVNIARTATGETITPKRAMQIGTVWACVWLIADTISTLPFCVMRKAPGAKYGLPDELNPLYTVIGSRPNTNMDATTYWQFMIASELLWGNAYSLKEQSAGQTVLLDTLLPQFVVPYRVKNTSSEIRYRYMPGGLTNEPLEDYSSDQVFHLRDRTLDGLVGLSRIEYARDSLGIARSAEMATSDVFRNGMRSNGFLMYDKTLKDEQRKQIKEALQTFKQGGEDAASWMVLEAGMKAEGISMPPQDVQLLASREFAVEDICRWFGVPPILVGHSATGVTAWGSGVEQLLTGFRALSLRPFIRRIEGAVAGQLVPIKDRGRVYLSIDTDDLLGADSISLSQLYSTYSQNGIMTRNEIRAKQDMPPKPGGDDLTVQSNLVPIEKLGEMGGQPTLHTPPPPPPPAKKAA